MTDVHRIRVFDFVPSPIVSTSLRKDTLLVARDSGYVEIWSVQNYSHCMCSFMVTTPKDIRVVVWTKFRGEKAFAVCLFSGEIVIYNYPALTIVAQSPSYGGAIWGAAVNEEQTLLAVACDDAVVRLFSTQDDLSIVQTSDLLTAKCLSVCFGKTGEIFAGSANGMIARIDPDNGQLVSSFDATTSSSSSSLELSIWALCCHESGSIISGDSNGNVIIWDPVTSTVETRFSSHQADILALAAQGNSLFASGIDPTLVTFELSENGWNQKGQQRIHTHDVTSISVNEKHLITAGMDACICTKTLIKPFQVQTPIAVATRGDDIIAVGAEGNQISIWKFTGEKAILELKLHTSDPVDAVAINRDATQVAYSANNTRIIQFDGAQWEFTKETRSKATALLFTEKNLYSATISGNVSTKDSYVNVGFPVFKLCVMPNEKYVVASGLKKLVCIDGELKNEPCSLPYFGSPVSAMTFKSNKTVLYVATCSNKILAYDVEHKKLIPTKTINLGKFRETVSPTSLSFDPKNHKRLLISSSQVTIVANLNKSVPRFRLPYEDYLFGSFAKGSKLVIYEKPWAFMMHSLPMPFRIKRFHGSDETKRPRY